MDAPDADLIDDLFRRHFAGLVRSLSLVAGPDAAADAVQEAFLIADRRRRRVRQLDDPVAWVRRVAVNRLLNDVRSDRRSRGRMEKAAAREPREDVLPDVDLSAAVAALPRQQRLVVGLYYLADLPVAEVAETLGVSAGTVKSNLHDARRRLRTILEVHDG